MELVINKNCETFDLLELPDPKSQLIKAECLKIKKDMNFENLSLDFAKLVNLIHLAENGAYGHCDIQIQIRDIGRIITQLTGDILLAIHAFERASAQITETLKTSYGYLLSSFEEEALIMLSSIDDITKKMLDTSERLKQDANIASEKIKNISNAAKRQNEEDVKNKKRIDIEKKILLIDMNMCVKYKEEAQAGLESLESKMNITVKKIEEAENSVHRWGIAGIFIPFLSTKRIFENAIERAENERREQQRLFEEEYHKISELREANEKMTAFDSKMLKLQYDDQSILIDSLNHAFSALCSIEGIIEAARMYWGKMYTYYEQLSTKRINRIIKNSLEKDDKAKKKLYQSKMFKHEIVNIYAKCVAVSETFLEYKGQMEETHNNMVKYLKENPSHEQSLVIIKTLAKKLFEKTEITDYILRIEKEQEANLLI